MSGKPGASVRVELFEPDAWEAFERMVPAHLRPGLRSYFTEHRPVGGFLTAVLSNDLAGAAMHADVESLVGLHSLVLWLYNYAPTQAWGSREAVKAWLAEDAP